MKIYIKYMVSLRCRMIAKKELSRLGLTIVEVNSGMVNILEDMSPAQRIQIQEILRRSGMYLLDESRSSLIERVKIMVTDKVNCSEFENLTPKLLAADMQQDFAEINTIFSEVNGISLEHYIMIQRIEKAKEYLLYNDLSLEEIAKKLHFESVALLKHQFSKVTGLKPLFFIELKKKREEARQKKAGVKPKLSN